MIGVTRKLLKEQKQVIFDGISHMYFGEHVLTYSRGRLEWQM